jgi:hypothetical protein
MLLFGLDLVGTHDVDHNPFLPLPNQRSPVRNPYHVPVQPLLELTDL